MAIEVPDEALGAAVGVLIYSIVCLCCSLCLLHLSWVHGDRFGYVSMLATFTGLGVVASIARNINTIVWWRDYKIQSWTHMVENVANPEVVFFSAAAGTNLTLYTIQYYAFSVQSIVIACWAAELALSVFRVQLYRKVHRLGYITKIIAILLPILQVGILKAPAVQSNTVAYFVIGNSITAVGFVAGAILLIAMLCRYIYTRKKLHSWRLSYDQQSAGLSSIQTVSGIESLYDRWLVVRFSIAFITLAIFELVIVLFQIISSTVSKSAALTIASQPPLTPAQAKRDFVLYIPGVSGALIAFVVFGTTKVYREYLWRKLVPKKIRDKWRKEEDDPLAANKTMSFIGSPDHYMGGPTFPALSKQYTRRSDLEDCVVLENMEGELAPETDAEQLAQWKDKVETENKVYHWRDRIPSA